jgi:hypothetical protein
VKRGDEWEDCKSPILLYTHDADVVSLVLAFENLNPSEAFENWRPRGLLDGLCVSDISAEEISGDLR